MGDALDVLSDAKSQLREDVRKLLVDALVKSNKSHAQLTSSAGASLSKQSIVDFLKQHGLEYTLSVFAAESESMHNEPNVFHQESSGQHYQSHTDLKLIAEQLWTRLERKYEAKMRSWQEARDAETKRQIESLRLDYQSSLDSKIKDLESDHALKLAHLQRQEHEMRSSMKRKLAAKEAALESQRTDLIDQLSDLEQKRMQLQQLQSEIDAFAQSQKERYRFESGRLNERSAAIRKQEMGMEERLEKLADDIQSKERARYADSLRKLTERERHLIETSDHLSAKLNGLQAYKKIAEERGKKVEILETQVNNADAHYERLAQENQSLRFQLRKCSDYDHVKRENDRLRMEVERFSNEDKGGAERRVAEAELAALRRQLVLTERAAELKDQEWKLRCENESAKNEDLTRTFKAQANELREMSRELVKLREQIISRPPEKRSSFADTSNNRRAAKAIATRFERGKSESAEDISSESTPDFVKDAKRRLKQLDKVSQQLDESIGAYRSNRQLTATIQTALALPTISSYVPPPAESNQNVPNSADAQMYTSAAISARKTDRATFEPEQSFLSTIPDLSAINASSRDAVPAIVDIVDTHRELRTVDEQLAPVVSSRQSTARDVGKSTVSEEKVDSWEAKLKAREEERRKRDEEIRLNQLRELEQLRIQEQTKREEASKASGSVTEPALQPSTAEISSAAEIAVPKVSAPEPEIDPVMQKYMQMVMQQREKEKQTEHQIKNESPRDARNAVVDDIEVGDVGTVSDDDFGEW